VRWFDNFDQLILSKAFRGELVSQDPHDEPASMVLDLIQKEKAHKTAEEKSRIKPKGKQMKCAVGGK